MKALLFILVFSGLIAVSSVQSKPFARKTRSVPNKIERRHASAIHRLRHRRRTIGIPKQKPLLTNLRPHKHRRYRRAKQYPILTNLTTHKRRRINYKQKPLMPLPRNLKNVSRILRSRMKHRGISRRAHSRLRPIRRRRITGKIPIRRRRMITKPIMMKRRRRRMVSNPMRRGNRRYRIRKMKRRISKRYHPKNRNRFLKSSSSLVHNKQKITYGPAPRPTSPPRYLRNSHHHKRKII